MRKRLWKKPLAVLMLSTALAMTLTACGEDKKETASKEVKSEYIYQSSFQTVDIGIDGIDNACMKDGRVYLYGSQWVEDKKDKEGGGKTHNYFITCNVDGSDVQKTELKGLKENEYSNMFVLDEDGQFRLLTQCYEYNEKTQESKESYFVHTLNEKGKITDTVELKRDKKKSNEDDYFYLDRSRVVFLDGKVYAAMDTKIYTFDEKGKAGKTYENEGGNYIQCLMKSAEGKLYVYGWINQGEESKNVLREFDPETGKFGDSVDFGEYNIYNLSVYPAEGSNVYINDGNNIYTVDLANGKLKTELNWLNSDIDGERIRAYFPLEEGKFLVVDTSYDETTQKSSTEFITLNKVKASEVKQKEVLTYASAYIDYDIKGKFISFNKTNEKYRIEVKDYSAYSEPSKQLNMDITSGKIPDILDLRQISKYQLIKKGVLTDLYPFMEKSEEVKKEDFIPSVLSTLENDGKLYFLPYSFAPQALIAGKKVVGDIEGWTVEEMIDLYKKMPEGSLFMEYMTREWFVSNIVNSQLSEYVNWSTGEVKFDTDDFIKLIEFSSEFSSQENMKYDNQDNMPTLVKKGKLFLNSLYLYQPSEIEIYTKLYKKQKGYSILSYPSSDKNNKLAISLNGCALAITNQCKNKEGAWEFISQFLTYEFQKNTTRYNGLPTRKDALEKILEYAQATEQYTDEDGTEVYPIDSSYGYDDYTVQMGPLSEEEITVIRSIIDRIGICNSYDTVSEEIMNIIQEELKAYYAGDKAAKDTADVIQSRVKLYVSENS